MNDFHLLIILTLTLGRTFHLFVWKWLVRAYYFYDPILWVVKFYYFIKSSPERYRHFLFIRKEDRYMKERLPELIQQTRSNDADDSNWAIAERLTHVKHIRGWDGVKTGEEQYEGIKK